MEGLLSTMPRGHSTTGTSATPIWNRSSSDCIPGSVSTSWYTKGWPLRVRKALSFRVAAEWRDPSRISSAFPWAMSPTRRRMKARIRISLSSESRCTSARR